MSDWNRGCSSWIDFAPSRTTALEEIVRGWQSSWGPCLVPPILYHIAKDTDREMRMPRCMIPPSWRGCWGTP